jgi:DNA-binding transcriptional MocR family regulator
VANSNGSGEPIYVRLLNCLKASIEAGELPLDSKLPTNRELASLLKIDRSTVSRAYNELAEVGFIESHVGRGTYVVSTQPQRIPPLPGAAWHRALSDNNDRQILKDRAGQKRPRPAEITWSEKFSRGSTLTSELIEALPPAVAEESDFISFAGGSPASDTMPLDDLRKGLGELLKSRRANQMFDYSPAEGDGFLRSQIMAYLSRQGMRVAEDELLILSGSQQGIDLVAATLIDPGDKIVIENPTYFWALCNFRARQAKFLPVDIDQNGMQVDQVESWCNQYVPKLIYTIPDFQNPTGATMSLKRRERLIEIANKYGAAVFEDRSVGELCYEGESLPAVRSLSGAANVVIHQGTLSKALCPGLRIGWLVGPPEVIARLRMAKRARDLSTNSVAQVLLANYLEKGLYESHLQRVKKLYRERRDTMLASLNQHFGAPSTTTGHQRTGHRNKDQALTWQIPGGGLFVWAKLPEGFSARELLAYAERRGVSFSPGDLYFTDRAHSEYLRLCFIQNDSARIQQGVARLADAVFQLLAKRRLGASFAGGNYAGSSNVHV